MLPFVVHHVTKTHSVMLCRCCQCSRRTRRRCLASRTYRPRRQSSHPAAVLYTDDISSEYVRVLWAACILDEAHVQAAFFVPAHMRAPIFVRACPYPNNTRHFERPEITNLLMHGICTLTACCTREDLHLLYIAADSGRFVNCRLVKDTAICCSRHQDAAAIPQRTKTVPLP